MKILMVSMNSIHFTRWTQQLEHSGHEVYWFNVYDSGYNESLPWVQQFYGWKKRFGDFRGRLFLKKYLPSKLFSMLFEKDITEAFEKVLTEVKPDCVHSFVMYVSCKPIEKIMDQNPSIKWVYSSWGSDLFYFKEFPQYHQNIVSILPKIQYLFTDCKRDYDLAKSMGFNRSFLGVIPGGGGFEFEKNKSLILPISERKIILVKGYENRSGRAINIIKALEKCAQTINEQKLEVILFGTTPELKKYLQRTVLSFKLIKKKSFQHYSHDEMMALMGKSLIYIGNSNSDGMPNTLLEAIGMGAFPIQSNPGGATAEVIEHQKNGLLIQDCEDVIEIATHIEWILNNKNQMEVAFKYNQEFKSSLERNIIKEKVINQYKFVEND